MIEIKTETLPRQMVVLAEHKINALLRAPDRRTRRGPRDACLLALLTAGLREREAVGLRVADVRREGRDRAALHVRTAKRRNHWRTVYLIGPAARAVLGYLERACPRFWLLPGGRRNNEPLTTRQARQIAKSYLAAIGVPAARVHDLRHSAATLAMRSTGGDSWLTAKMLGHSSQRMVEQTYAHFADRDAHRVAEAMAAALARGGRPRREVAAA